MEIFRWLTERWGDLLQPASIIVGFIVTVHTIRSDTQERKINNLFTLTAAHRELWIRLYEKPELSRILESRINLRDAPPTLEEELFVHLLILHLYTSFKARRAGMEFSDDALSADIRQFFARPIARAIWANSKRFFDKKFVGFVEASF